MSPEVTCTANQKISHSTSRTKNNHRKIPMGKPPRPPLWKPYWGLEGQAQPAGCTLVLPEQSFLFLLAVLVSLLAELCYNPCCAEREGRARRLGPEYRALEPGRAHGQLHYRQRHLWPALLNYPPTWVRRTGGLGCCRSFQRHHHALLRRGGLAFHRDRRPLSLRPGCFWTLHRDSDGVAYLAGAAGLGRRQR